MNSNLSSVTWIAQSGQASALSMIGGQDGAAYLAIRDPWGNAWMGRVQGSSWGGWYKSSNGVVLGQGPELAGYAGKIYAGGIDTAAGVYLNTFNEGLTNGWGSWVGSGALTNVSAASGFSGAFLVGGTGAGIYWYSFAQAAWFFQTPQATTMACSGVTPQAIQYVKPGDVGSFLVAANGVTGASAVEFTLKSPGGAISPLPVETRYPTWKARVDFANLPNELGLFTITATMTRATSRAECGTTYFTRGTQVLPQPTSCASLSGIWNENRQNWNAVWTLSQSDVLGSNGFPITGTVTANVVNGCSGTYQVTGYKSITGTFVVNGVNSTPAPGCSPLSPQYSGHLKADSCDSATGSWTASGGVSGDFTWVRNACAIPASESSRFTIFNTSGFDTQAGFKADLSSSDGFNFIGRKIDEATPTPGNDGCYNNFPNSDFQPLLTVTTGPWWVGQGNSYGEDWIGFAPSRVAYYRKNGATPCTVTIPQQMKIQCTGGLVPFGSSEHGNTNTLQFTVGDTSLQFRRGTATAQK